MAEQRPESVDRFLELDPVELRGPCVCIPRSPAIAKLADELGFTYEEAFEYVITAGLAYARPARGASEPGA